MKLRRDVDRPIARQPWQLTRLLLPVLITALVPAPLSEILSRVDTITDRLLATDGRRSGLKQVDTYRAHYEPTTWSRLATRC